MTATPIPPPQLLIVQPEPSRVVAVNTPQFIIGRAEDCQLSIASPRLSRQHAEISWAEGRYWIADLRSRNGTFLNGKRLSSEKQLLKHGDRIQLGSFALLQFEDVAATETEHETPVLLQGLWLDNTQHEVFIHAQRVSPALTDKLFRLLSVLVMHEGRFVAKDEIAQHVWPEAQGNVADQMIDTLVARLRRRLAEVDGGHAYIERVRNRGLRFVQSPTKSK